MADLAFMYEVIFKSKSVIERAWETDATPSQTFGDFFELIAPDRYKDFAVVCNIGHKRPENEPNQFVKVKLHQKLALLTLQKANFVRFQILPREGKYLQFFCFA